LALLRATSITDPHRAILFSNHVFLRQSLGSVKTRAI